MLNLSQEQCQACRADAPKVSDNELKQLLAKIPDWNIETRDGVMQLEKTFQFKDFVTALDFTNKVAEIAEQAGISYRSCRSSRNVNCNRIICVRV